MVDDGYATTIGKVVLRGTVPFKTEKSVETAANVYPGRLAIKGTTDNDIVVGDGASPPVGWVGYEDTAPEYRKDAIGTIQTILDRVAVMRGGGFTVNAKLAAGFVSKVGDYVCSWGLGCVAVCEIIRGKICIRVAFVKKTSEFDTGIDFPTHAIVDDVFVLPTTHVGSATIDIGILSSEGGGDADGFLDGEPSAADNTWAVHNMVDATGANDTLGVLLYEVQIKDATGTPVYYSVPKIPGWDCDGTAKSLSYTTTNSTNFAGYFFVAVSSRGVQIVGRAGKAVDASSAVADLPVESSL